MPKTKKTPSKRKPNAAFMRPVQPDDKLVRRRRLEATSPFRAHQEALGLHQEERLQDKKKRTQINADDALKPVFNGKSQVSMFEMTKLVSGHIK